MSECKICSAALGPRNKSGFCRKHAFAGAWATPGFAEKQRAGIRRKIAQDPEYKDMLRRRARALSADKSVSERRSRAFIENKTWEKGSVAARTPEVRAKAGRTNSERRLSWCPHELRDEYRTLVNTHHYKAAEARAMIEEQHEMEMARWRRSVGIVVPVGPLPEPEIEPVGLSPIEHAIELAAKRFGTTVADIVSSSRHREHVVPRYALAVAMRSADMSFPAIAKALGASDHSSSIHWRKQGLARAKVDRRFAKTVDELVACWPALDAAA